MAFVNITNNTFNPYSKETLNEGQFSWMTYDTDKQIGSEKQNTINVYMYDNEGNQWFEKKYDGYGEFGGMDYYALLAKMNGYSAEDITKKGMEMRDLGIDLAFNKLKTKAKGGKVLFPALVEDPKFNWKRHDFTQEAESDENQSWYQEPDYDEEEDDDYENGWYESLKTNEGAMSEIHIMAKEAKDAEDFKKEFYKEYGTKIKKSGETDKWIKELYVDATNESAITEAKLTRGLKPLLTIGSTITKKAGEDALLDLSDKFDRIDDEYAGTIASWLDMAIELMQDGYGGDATKKLKQFNKACKDVLNGKEVGSAFESVTEKPKLTWNTLKESLGINEGRSINKISKDLEKTVLGMKQTVDAWKEAEGDRKSELLEKLRELNKEKAKLEKELNDAVAGKDHDLQLALEEAKELAYLELDVIKILND